MGGKNDNPVIIHQAPETASSINSASTLSNLSWPDERSSDSDMVSYESRMSGDSEDRESRGNSSVREVDYTLTLKSLPS
jgi:hypothetical protein